MRHCKGRTSFVHVDNTERAAKLGVSNPFWEIEFNFILAPKHELRDTSAMAKFLSLQQAVVTAMQALFTQALDIATQFKIAFADNHCKKTRDAGVSP